jgi:sterol 24-C-methyltransferase
MLLATFIVALAIAAYVFRDSLAKIKFQFSYKHVDDLDKLGTKFTSDFRKDTTDDDKKRRDEYTATTQSYYNLVTSFYEYGWGKSFHFAPKYLSETFDEGCKRYEHWFASQLNVPKGAKVLDVGCGVGGPMREIWRASNTAITGVNITEEHIRRAKKYCAEEGVTGCDFICADYNEIPVPDAHFDAAYDMEAILHSTDRKRTFTEVIRTLKPGARFVTAQYVVLPAYDEKNADHVRTILDIDNTNGCYISTNGAWTRDRTYEALVAAGFKVITDFNAFTAHGTTGFHEVFKGTAGGQFFGTALGRKITTALVSGLETIGLAPAGTSRVQQMLGEAADAFTKAGDMDLMTPGWVFVCEKPE